MAENKYRDFMGDEKLEELQDKLNEAKIKSEKHKALEKQSKANLELFEKITTDSAIKLAECQSNLANLTQQLQEKKAELSRQTDLMHQQEMVNKAKAYTLQAAQKELEESQMRYCKTIETVNKLHSTIEDYEKSIEKAGIQVKSAYNNWQHNYNHLQEQKSAAEKNNRTVAQLQAQIENLSNQQEISKNQAADRLADTIILNLDNNLDITDLNIENLPKATLSGNPVIPEIPPIDDELAKLIKEATTNTGGEFASFRPEMKEQEDTDSVLLINNEESANDQENNLDNKETAEKDFWEKPKTEKFSATEVFAEMKAKKENTAITIDANTLETNADETIPEKTPKVMPVMEKSINEKPEIQDQDTTKELISEEKPKKKHRIFGYIICILIAIIIAFLLKTFVFQITEISGDSMEPTLTSGERAISSPISYYFNDVEQYDIIVFEAPDRTDKAYYVKRVIGLPGDHVVIKDGNVWINGTQLSEDYINNQKTAGEIDTLVPNGEYFVLGDNREVSHDSRNPDVGTISHDRILGKLIYQIYPFDNIGKIE
jgi:signal peptidase I